MSPTVSRRTLCLWGAATVASQALAAPVFAAEVSAAHKGIGELDRSTILAAAQAALHAPLSSPPSQDFHSEVEPVLTTAGASSQPKLLRADATALLDLSSAVSALAAGFLLTNDDAYAARAVLALRPWFLQPDTRLQPSFDRAGCAPGTNTGTPAGVVDLVPLAELARALSFLTDHLAPEDLQGLQTWCAATLTWLTENRAALIAQDTKDHRASAHLLITASLARFLRNESQLEACRKRFRTHTLRNQVRADGVFPQEVATPNPYRNTLFNFDLLCGACQVLSTPFDLLWQHELIDGVGLRIVAAYLYPVVDHPERWGFPADARFFRDLPGRRPGLLFAGRAYDRPEYVELWRRLPAATPESIASSFPIRQPLLWTTRPPHGL